MRKHILHLSVLAFLLLAPVGQLAAGDGGLPDWMDKPLGTVGPLGKVGPLGTVGQIGSEGFRISLPDGLRANADTGYLVCWTWSTSKDSEWRCTRKYVENPRDALEFATYQNEKYSYQYGKSFVQPVFKSLWDNGGTRQKIMDRIKIESIPAILDRLASREQGNNAELAARIRKQISFIKMDWVEVKPVLGKDSKEYKELKAGKVEASKKIGFDDDAPRTSSEAKGKSDNGGKKEQGALAQADKAAYNRDVTAFNRDLEAFNRDDEAVKRDLDGFESRVAAYNREVDAFNALPSEQRTKARRAELDRKVASLDEAKANLKSRKAELAQCETELRRRKQELDKRFSQFQNR